MVDYLYYSEKYNGKVSEGVFDVLVNDVYSVLKLFIEQNIPYWRIDEKLLEDERFNDLICKQIDFLDKVGGINSVLDGGNAALKVVETSGFKYEYDQSTIKRHMLLDGIPFSPFVRSGMLTILRQMGLMNRGIG